MTIYVDNIRIPATVGRYRDRRWCHLVSDDLDPAELHAFAERIGLKRAWFQPGRPHSITGIPDPVSAHYDVTEAKRREAVAAGAVQIDLREFSELLGRKRAAWRAQQGGTPGRAR